MVIAPFLNANAVNATSPNTVHLVADLWYTVAKIGKQEVHKYGTKRSFIIEWQSDF